LPLVLTGVLVATSIPIQAAVAAARRGRAGIAVGALALALVVQAGYFAMQVHQYLGDLDKFSPKDTAYGSIYFTMLGAHHAHVVIGMLLVLWFLGRLSTGITRYRLVGLQATAFYWHFVNLLALLVVGAQLSAAV
jgi:heme/copper-type cytochrome/quinol oxidase subunit 3